MESICCVLLWLACMSRAPKAGRSAGRASGGEEALVLVVTSGGAAASL